MISCRAFAAKGEALIAPSEASRSASTLPKVVSGPFLMLWVKASTMFAPASAPSSSRY